MPTRAPVILKSSGRRRTRPRPSGAYKLLVMLLDGHFPRHLEIHSGGVLRITSLRGLGRTLGASSTQVRGWLGWLEEQGYVSDLDLSENHRQAILRVRPLRNQMRALYSDK